MKKIIVLLCAIFLCFPAYSTDTKTAGNDVSQASIIMPYKDVSKKWRVINKMKKQTRELSEEDKSIIKKYVFGAVRGEEDRKSVV